MDAGALRTSLFGLEWAREGGTSPAAWEAVLDRCASVPAAYTPALRDYQAQYVRDRVDEYVDLSVLLLSGGKPVGVWPLAATRDGNAWQFASQEGPVRTPLFAADVRPTTRKKLTHECLDWLFDAARKGALSELVFTESVREGALDAWHKSLVERGGTIKTQHGLYVDLSRPLEEIRANMRDSVKSRVNKGMKVWKVSAIDSAAPEVFDEFRALHREVAGRVTRSLETWQLQQRALADRDALLVTLRDGAGRLVGGGYFALSRTECLYAVGAYDRTLFDQPLGHVVQWQAVVAMKARGLSWYFIGVRPYPQDVPAPTDKEVQIGHFKESFATHVFPHFEVRCPV